MTVVFDASQNSQATFEHIAGFGLHHVGSVPPSDVPDLLALPKKQRRTVDVNRLRRADRAADPAGDADPLTDPARQAADRV
jgi:hypothetical protein